MLLYRYYFVLLCISKYKPPGVYIRSGDLTEGFLRYELGGYIFGVRRGDSAYERGGDAHRLA